MKLGILEATQGVAGNFQRGWCGRGDMPYLFRSHGKEPPGWSLLISQSIMGNSTWELL